MKDTPGNNAGGAKPYEPPTTSVSAHEWTGPVNRGSRALYGMFLVFLVPAVILAILSVFSFALDRQHIVVTSFAYGLHAVFLITLWLLAAVLTRRYSVDDKFSTNFVRTTLAIVYAITAVACWLLVAYKLLSEAVLRP